MMRGGDSKYRVIIGPKDLPLLPPAVGIATGDLIKNHPDKLRAILAGRREAVKFIYREYRRTPAKFSSRSTRRCRQTTSIRLMQQLVDAKFYSEGKIEMLLLQTTVNVMAYVGMIDKDRRPRAR